MSPIRNLNELKDKVHQERLYQREKQRQYMRNKYRHARVLGFSAEEAHFLRSQSFETINKLAEEKKQSKV